MWQNSGAHDSDFGRPHARDECCENGTAAWRAAVEKTTYWRTYYYRTESFNTFSAVCCRWQPMFGFASGEGNCITFKTQTESPFTVRGSQLTRTMPVQAPM